MTTRNLIGALALVLLGSLSASAGADSGLPVRPSVNLTQEEIFDLWAMDRSTAILRRFTEWLDDYQGGTEPARDLESCLEDVEDEYEECKRCVLDGKCDFPVLVCDIAELIGTNACIDHWPSG